MGGVQRNWVRVDRYAKKGRHVGGVHDMTEAERQALCKGTVRKDDEERRAEIMARRARIRNAEQEAS